MTDTLAKVNGNKTRMSDFDMFSKIRETAGESAASSLAFMAGAGMRKLGQGRRK
ncbi:MAG TPA: hypothetical protein VN280_22575 [Variovorax sp.]|nr:hypothetical protein [Variovorax sp.]